MKFYATIFNENRKHEGIGGNESIGIELTIGNRNLYHIEFNAKFLRVYSYNKQENVFVDTIKGIKQKGKKIYPHTEGHSINCTCPDCCSIS